MRQKVKVRFEYADENGVRVYDKDVEFPERPPIPFHAVCSFGYFVFWQEKLALKARIEDLEAELEKVSHQSD